MISPALITFSFYRNSIEKQDRMDRLQRRLIDLGACGNSIKVSDWAEGRRETKPPMKTVELSKKISAFNVIFSGNPIEIPICSPEELAAAKVVLGEGLIDAYMAGIPSENNNEDRYYEGNILGVALALSNALAIRISADELSTVLGLISNDEKRVHVSQHIAGYESELRKSIMAKCQDAGYDLSFLTKIKGWRFFGF